MLFYTCKIDLDDISLTHTEKERKKSPQGKDQEELQAEKGQFFVMGWEICCASKSQVNRWWGKSQFFSSINRWIDLLLLLLWAKVPLLECQSKTPKVVNFEPQMYSSAKIECSCSSAYKKSNRSSFTHSEKAQCCNEWPCFNEPG